MPPAKRRFHVWFRAAHEEHVQDLPLEQFAIVSISGVQHLNDGSYALQAVVPQEVLKKLKAPARVRAEDFRDCWQRQSKKPEQAKNLDSS